ncbi:MAG: aminotransferase class V-fold PLP-dependent enzyme [Pseudomonadota bacterium]
MNGQRVYLDWNATAPLRPEARAAMLEAMDVVGNPSSVHAEGRAAKAIVEKARGQVAALVGCDPDEVVFTSGATEAAAILMYGDDEQAAAEIEHACILDHINDSDPRRVVKWRDHIAVDEGGIVTVSEAARSELGSGHEAVLCLQAANSETGIMQSLARSNAEGLRIICDAAQICGKSEMGSVPNASEHVLLSGHKFGANKGIGALVTRRPIDLEVLLKGGGQEKGRRSGTENVVGIAGFGAAAEAAQRHLEDGVWEPVEKLRNILEDTLAEAAPETIFFGQESPRLPNTSCFAVPGWRGETQVMQMDLAGFAVSAGSACSSGKVNKASRVLLAMGFDEITASSAIRVSMGPTTTEAEVMAFADAWKDAYRRRKARAA